MRNGASGARGRLNGLSVAILAGFGLIALALAYWTILRGPSILGRGDNPRLVEAELRIQRGTILDANNLPLAETSGTGADLRRVYPLSGAAPAVGYYSFRHGTAGIEEAFDDVLRGASGDFWSDFWHIETLGESQVGRDVRLTLDSRWQAAADTLLGDHNGAVLLFSLPDVAVRAVASQPGFDPNRLDEDFEQLTADQQAPLLNRVTQGQYQPGLLLQPFLLAIGQRDDRIDLKDSPSSVAGEIVVDGVPLECQAAVSESPTWGEALQASCPGPMLELGQQMGGQEVLKALGEFGLLERPVLAIATEGGGDSGVVDAGLAAIGQDTLAVSPLQIGLALAALANDGQLKPAQLVLATQDVEGNWLAAPDGEEGIQVIPAQIAAEILGSFSEFEGITEHDVLVLSGPEGELNSWYLGLAPAADPRYGVVVVVEDDDDISSAQVIGRTLLKEVLDPGP